MFKNITLDKAVRFVISLTAVILLVLILYYYVNLLAYAIIAMLLSYLLDPVINRMQAVGFNRTLAIVMTLTSVVLIIVWISTSVIPIFANQIAGLTRELGMETVRDIVIQIENRLIAEFEFIPYGFLRNSLPGAVEGLFDVSQMPNILGRLIGIFTNLFYALLVIPFATFFFLKDGSKIRRDLLQLVPNKYFETILSLLDKIETRLGYYFRSVFIQSILVTITSWITLSIAGLENSASVGLTIGIANTIPYFGPILGYILSIVVSIIEAGDFSLVFACVMAVLVVQIMDNIVFQPMLFSKSADMHPVAILFIILIGAETAGLIGMLIAIPIATIIKITINQVSWSFNNYYIFREEITGPPAADKEPVGKRAL